MVWKTKIFFWLNNYLDASFYQNISSSFKIFSMTTSVRYQKNLNITEKAWVGTASHGDTLKIKIKIIRRTILVKNWFEIDWNKVSRSIYGNLVEIEKYSKQTVSWSFIACSRHKASRNSFLAFLRSIYLRFKFGTICSGWYTSLNVTDLSPSHVRENILTELARRLALVEELLELIKT